MTGFEHELRLLWAISINTVLAVAAYRAARKLGDGDRVQNWLDTLLLWWVGQYAVVGILGVVGLSSPVGIAVLGAVVAVGVSVVCRKIPPLPMGNSRERTTVFAGLSVVGGYVIALLWHLRHLPPMSDDPLTYHLPAAATWLLDQRITIYETWFFNPANTYSPLAGSIFATWLIAPFGNDVAARFMQGPAIIAIYLASVQIGRRLGATVLTATLLATASAMCAPIIRQVGLAKDDLFLTAFVLMCINAIGKTDRLGAWRFGIALGLAAGTKVTSVYTLVPMLFLLLPLRVWNWRRLTIAVGCAVAIAGPWYLRNWLAYGNPIFPVEVRLHGVQIFPGLFETTHSPRLRDLAGLSEIFITGYFSLGRTLAAVVSVAIVGAIAFSWRRIASDRIVRICVLGPLMGTAAFIATSPYGEIRFLYPWIVTALLCLSLWPERLRAPLAVAAVTIAIVTGFEPDLVAELLPAVLSAVVMLFILFCVGSRSQRMGIATIGVSGIFLSTAAYVNWRSYILSLPEYADRAWEDKYGDLGKAWTFFRTQTRADEPIAYTGTYLTHPLKGPNLRRRVIHVPVGRTVTDLSRMPRFSEPMSARNMLRTVIPAMQMNPDQVVWLERLRRSGVSYLLIDLHPPASTLSPVEWSWVARDNRFRQVFASGSVVVFKVLPAQPATNLSNSH